jgi:hypothetical protein
VFEDAPNGVGRGEEGDHLAARAAVLADEDIEDLGSAEQSCAWQALVCGSRPGEFCASEELWIALVADRWELLERDVRGGGEAGTT